MLNILLNVSELDSGANVAPDSLECGQRRRVRVDTPAENELSSFLDSKRFPFSQILMHF